MIDSIQKTLCSVQVSKFIEQIKIYKDNPIDLGHKIDRKKITSEDKQDVTEFDTSAKVKQKWSQWMGLEPIIGKNYNFSVCFLHTYMASKNNLFKI